MKRLKMLIVLLLLSAPLFAQQFIGCREGDRWAETPKLRTAFHIDHGELRHADFQTITFRIFVVSLGYHEVYVNGMKVSDRVMQPAVSQLDRHALRVSYDITGLVHEGDNELMLWLGQGWGRIYGTPAVSQAWVEKSVSDGECGLIETFLASDSTWETSPSPYSYTGSWQPMQFGGERYDARIRERWRPATVWYAGCQPAVTQQEFGGNRIVDTVPFVSYEREPDGSTVIDFGRVVTGWFAAVFVPFNNTAGDDEEVSLPEGTEVTMEYLDHREAQPPFTETDIYISDGKGRDLFRNRFHTHSFRYVRIKGAGLVAARALQISAVDPSEGATFSCSDPRLNAIHDMVKYTLSCLTFNGYMVDCPHIERMGYGGDGNSSTDILQTLWDVRPTYLNWLSAWADAMDSTGDLPYVAPAFRTGGGPYWQSFIVKAPWRTYLNYGDRTLIYRHYDQMKRWLDFVEAHSVDGLLQPWPDTDIVRLRPFGRDPNWFLGDWAVPDGVDKGGESVLHVSSCVVSDCLKNMEQMARMTRRTDDAKLFAERQAKVNAAIHRRFYHPETHTYANGTPLDQCFALLLGIPPDSATAAQVKAQLLEDCHGKYRDHIAAGLVGVPIFTEWCIRERHADLMATILRQPDYPGYLNMMDTECVNALMRDCVSADAPATNAITQSHTNAISNASTTWESWDCGRPGKEDRSRVHNCYNGIGIWFYQSLAGIRPDPMQPGYKHFFIDPQPCTGIDWVRATKPTPYGDISVIITDKVLQVIVPEGTTATLFPGTARERTVGSGVWTVEQ